MSSWGGPGMVLTALGWSTENDGGGWNQPQAFHQSELIHAKISSNIFLGSCKMPGAVRVVSGGTIPAWCPQLFPDKRKGDRVGDGGPHQPDPGEGAKYSDLEKFGWVYGCPPGSREAWRSPAPSHHPVPG